MPGHNTEVKRYHSVSIVLHWLMALCFFVMLGSGFVMVNVELERATQFDLYQWHKSLGVLLLMAIVLRLAMRLFTRRPSIPGQFSVWEHRMIKAGHWGFYVLMLVIPLSGWVMVSASKFGLPTIVFDWFEWPHIPGIARNAEIEAIAKWVHLIAVSIFALTILAHISAVVKHARIDKVNLLRRMWWTKSCSSD